MKKIVLILLLIITVFVTGAYSDSSLSLGIFPSFSPKILVSVFKPFADRIKAYTGREIVLSSAPDRAVFEQRTLEGRYDIIWTCNSCYLEAEKKAGYTSIVSGEPPFRGIVMVDKESEIYQLEQLRGKKIVGVHRNSIAGYSFFRNDMIKLGMQESKDYEMFFDENIEALPFMVLSGKYDAVVFSEDSYFNSGIYDSSAGKLRKIAESVPIPQFPFAVNPLLDAGTVDKIREALLSFSTGDEADRKILERLRVRELKRTDDSDFDDFRILYNEIMNFRN